MSFMACLLTVMVYLHSPYVEGFVDKCVLHSISFGTSPAPENFWFKSKIAFLIKLERVDFSSLLEYKLKMGVSSF